MCFSIPWLRRNPSNRLLLRGWWEPVRVTPFFAPYVFTRVSRSLAVCLCAARAWLWFFFFFFKAYSWGSLLIGSFYKWVRWPSRCLCGINSAVCLHWLPCKIKHLLVCYEETFHSKSQKHAHCGVNVHTNEIISVSLNKSIVQSGPSLRCHTHFVGFCWAMKQFFQAEQVSARARLRRTQDGVRTRSCRAPVSVT